MKVKTSTKSPAPDIIAGIATTGVCIFWGPMGLITYPLFRFFAKRRVARDIDSVSTGDVEKIVDTWKNSRNVGERHIEVSRTVPFGGLKIPSTREYKFSLDKDEV